MPTFATFKLSIRVVQSTLYPLQEVDAKEGKGQVYRLKEPNPFAGEESGQVASVAYRLACIK